MRKRISVLAVALLLVGLNGCAKPPQTELDSAKAALESAKGAGAKDYAANSLKAAEDAQAQLEVELKAQEDKFALFRSYKKATELASAAKSAADKAADDARMGKEQKKGEASAAIGEAKTMLEATTGALATAPTGKGAQADLAAMKADLEAVGGSIAEAESAFAAEKYIDAKAKAEAAKTTIQGVQSAIDQAKQARQAARAAHRG